MHQKTGKRSPWSWVPSLYFAEGIPYIVVMQVAVLMYKRLGVSNTELALYTSWLYLPWVIKPLWSPFVDTIRTKRFWIIIMQLVIGAGLAGVALTLPGPNFLKFSLAFLWLLAFSSATHDIAADGFYMIGLSTHDQAWFVGIRSTFYRLAMITGQGLLVVIAGSLESGTGLPVVEFPVSVVEQIVDYETLPDQARIPGEAQSIEFIPATISFSRTQDHAAIDSLIAAATAHNVSNGFYAIDVPLEREPSLWSRTVGAAWGKVVATPLETLLRGIFDVPVVDSNLKGSVGIGYLAVTGTPESGQQLVVNLDRAQKNADISVAVGNRLTFTEANWNTPAYVVFQADPKLRGPTTASFEARSGNLPFAWAMVFALLSVAFLLLMLLHTFVLPRPANDRPVRGSGSLLADFGSTFASFFRKPAILTSIAFILFFRFSEAQLVKLASPFLVDTLDAGGMALTTGQVGVIYGTVGLLALTLGGIIGGWLAARDGLRRWFWPMVIAINVPNAVYLYLATVRPESLLIVNVAVAIEQFGYGFGFTAFLLYLIFISEGEHKTAHYAICTGFMALGMMIPGMFSGWLQDIVGYQNFFLWILIATLPGFIVSSLVKFDPFFGKKTDQE
ncbi:MAG: MFS transporter [Rhodothermales bacterium]|nr:MFS transporter [Rhodothermales bacterium]